MMTHTKALREGPRCQEANLFKLRIFRVAVALSSFGALLMAVGADRKWG
jgi:hypothetical protein